MQRRRMKPLWKIRTLLADAERVMLVAHVSPDGDTIGSVLGLAWALRKRGVTCRLACADPVPQHLRFLPGSDAFAARKLSGEQPVILVDISDPQRIGLVESMVSYGDVSTIVIDHHATNQGFGDVNLIAAVESTAQLILELIDALEIELDPRIATCLLTGLVTDTRCFRTNNTTSKALSVAARLMEVGAPLGRITEAVYNHRPDSALRLWGEAMRRGQLKGGVLWTAISQSLFRDCEADSSDAKGLVEFLRGFDGARIAAVFREIDGGMVDVSLRSRAGYDVAQVATRFAGGGHPQAAGCTLEGPLEEATQRVVAELLEVAQSLEEAG